MVSRGTEEPPAVEDSVAAEPLPSANGPTQALGTGSAGGRAVTLLGQFAVLVGFVVMVGVFIALEPSTFLTWTTIKNILDQSAVPVILVSGLTFVLVIGEFDLSFTAIIGLGAGVSIKLLSGGGVGVAAAIAVTVIGAALIGIAVGAFVSLGQASSFIVTLAIGSVLTGAELALTDNKTIYQGVPESYGKLASNSFLGVHLPVWLALVILVLGVVLLHGTRFGRHAKAVGENRTAAYLAGLQVRKITIVCFVLVAALSGVAAIVLTARSSSYYPNSSSGFLLSIYAAAFLGAAVGAHSRFTVAGSALGVLWLTTLQTGLTLHNEPAWVSSVIQGLVLAAAVLLSAQGRRTTR